MNIEQCTLNIIKILFFRQFRYFESNLYPLDFINTKLLSLINSFSQKEIEEFAKFISSPFFTKGRNYLPYFEYILKFKSNPAGQSKQNTGNPGLSKKFSRQTLRNRYSELYKLGEEFLIYNGLNENKTEKSKILLTKLAEKKLFVPFNIKYKETLKILKNEKYDNDLFKDISNLSELNSIFLQYKNKVDQIYNEHYEYSKIILCLNLIQLFELGFEFKQQEFDNRKYEPRYILNFLGKLDLDEMMYEFSRSDFVIFKVTSMNYFLYKAFENEENEDSYKESHRIFTTQFSELKDTYKVKIFNHMINYCIRKRNSGDLKYEHQLFRLYNEKLDQNLIMDLKNNNYLFNYFRDYVLIGISIREFKWVENFIMKYSHVLPFEIREDETRISYAKLDFAKKKYEASLTNLKNIKKTYYLLYIDSSVIKLCIYFEMKRYEDAFLEIDRLRHYLRNHKGIPKVHINTVLSFIKIYQTLLKYKTNPGKTDFGFVEKDLNSMTLVSNRKWLMEKISEFLH